MPVHSYQTLQGAEPVLHRVAAEVRFSRSGDFYGQLGRIISLIEKDHPEWLVGPEGIRTAEVAFISMQDGTEVSIADTNYRIVLTARADRAGYQRDDVIDFSRTCGWVDDLYRDLVKPEEVLRLGYREWWYFYFDNEESAQSWLHDLALFSASPLDAEFGGKPTKSSYVGVFNADKFDVRVSLNVLEFNPEIEREDQVNTIKTHHLSKKQKDSLIEQQRRHASRVRLSKGYAAVLDFDAYEEYPVELDILHFVQDRNRELFERIRKAVGNRE